MALVRSGNAIDMGYKMLPEEMSAGQGLVMAKQREPLMKHGSFQVWRFACLALQVFDRLLAAFSPQ